MNRTSLIISILVLGATIANASTFNPAAYLSEEGVDVLTRDVANQKVQRDLFGTPYATAVVGNVDIYDRFPYVESRYFQIVSDPSWNRLLMGELGQSLVAYDGAMSGYGALDAPHGISSDALGRVYVADTGNNRVMVFRAVSEYDKLELEVLYVIDELNGPWDVAYSDGGTPFDAADDRLYVANTGRNEVRRYEISDTGARMTHAIGELGSGVGHFAGPMAVTVSHDNGANGDEVYVSDAHNGRIVQLHDAGGVLHWQGAVSHALGAITSLDTDHWGNVYAAAPQAGSVSKFTPSLLQVATFSGSIDRPRSFHVPFATVTDHRSGEQRRAGQGSGLLVEQWNHDHGIRMLNLGVEVRDAAVVEDDETAFRVTITDHATVVAEISDPATGRAIARHDAGELDAGPQMIRFAPQDYLAAHDVGDYRLKVTARSTYDDNVRSELDMDISLSSVNGPALPDHVVLEGNTPNPFNPTTMIRFSVPAGGQQTYSLRVYDVRGHLVRELASGRIGAGFHEVTWDGHNGNGNAVGSGIYLYRLDVGAEKFTGKMVMVK